MNIEKLAILEKAMSDFTDNEEVGDGEDGYYSDTLHIEMARAAEAVYDSAMSMQTYMRDEGLNP